MKEGDGTMSKSGKKKQDTTESQEKVLTRYDLKMQRRREQKKKEEREKKVAKAVGILLLTGLVCLVASFPIRNYLTVHGTYIMVADENVSRVEFDYNYNLVKNRYLNQNYYYLSLFGLDLSGDLSKQMFSDTLTWQDFFEEMAVDNLRQNKALKKEMEAAGFTYDVTQDYEEYLEKLRSVASDAGMSVNTYVQDRFGTYATISRIEDCVKEGLITSAYYESVRESKMPSDEEITAYYEENKDDYDSVDYRLTLVEAELPTEPTELADPVEETDNAGDAVTGEDGETEYKPSEAEIEFAMSQAKAEAEEVEKTVFTEGELRENLLQSNITTLLQEWLFDSSRVSGDTTIIEDTTYNRYYVLAFVNRYLSQTPTADIRIILTESDNAQAILDEWKAGEATEESFAALANQYNDPLYFGTEGGLIEAQTSNGLSTELTDWIYDETRSGGDTAIIASGTEGNDYIIYYVGSNEPQWKVNIRNTLLDDIIMAEYMDEIVQKIEVKDPKGKLYYLKVQALEEAAAENNGDSADESEDTSNAE